MTRFSLRLRLLLTMIAVVLATAGTIALVAQQSALSEFQHFIDMNDARNQELGRLFQQASLLNTMDVQARQVSVERMAGEFGERIVLADAQGGVVADSAKALIGRPVTEVPSTGAVLLQLVDPTKPIAGAPQNQYAIPVSAGRTEPFSQSGVMFKDIILSSTLPISDQVLLYIAPTGDSSVPNVPEQLQAAPAALSITWAGLNNPDPVGASFASGLNRSLIAALVVAGIVAFLLTWLLSRQIIRPVEELTRATERMAQGDLGHRVAISSRDEIGGLGRAFNSMANALQRAETLRRTMVGDIAHELRTPLTNIQGYLEAMRDGLARPNRLMIDSLYEEALLLNRLITDLQDLTLAEAGQLRLIHAPTELGALLTHVVRMVQPQMDAKQIACRLNLPEHAVPVWVDSERISQVMRNLLNNAITHTPPDGRITVSLSAGSPSSGNVAATVRIADTGAGITSEDLPLIFERFYRADRSRNRATGGSGLGLTIVRYLVEAHGGTVSVESQVGQGSCFSFTLPAGQNLAGEAQSHP